MLQGRSPLKSIQHSRRRYKSTLTRKPSLGDAPAEVSAAARSKPAQAKKASLKDGCVEVSAATRPRQAAGRVRATAAGPPPLQPVGISHSYETRAAANRRRAGEAGLGTPQD